VAKNRVRVTASDVDRVVRVLRAGATTVADVLAALEPARRPAPDREVVKAYQRDLRRYERRVSGLHSRIWVGSVGAAGAAVAAVPATNWWLLASAAAAGLAVDAAARLRRVRAPQPPPEPAPPLPRLPSGATGAASVARLARAEQQLAAVIPAVTRLHPDAGNELRTAASTATPALHHLADRLAVLQGVREQMVGTEAGSAAVAAAAVVAGRLDKGAAMYEGLLAASATLLGAPDLDRSVEEVVAPAVESLRAYTYGLAVAQPRPVDD
jgi:hypothetical protein